MQSVTLAVVIGGILLFSAVAAAEVRIVTATGEYRMGDNDTRTDAKRLALLDAKRLALEQAGVYIESITEVKNLDLAKEEIRAYTAGIVEVVEQATRTTMEGETTVVHVDVATKIDTDVVARQIESLRKNEDVRAKLLRAEGETQRLRRELEILTRELARKDSEEEIRVKTFEREAVTKRIAANEHSQRALVLWSDGNNEQAERLTEAALNIDPSNLLAQGTMCLILLKKREGMRAVPQCRKVTNLMPESGFAHHLLGLALMLDRKTEEAEKEFRHAIHLDPNNEDSHAHLGSLLALKDQWDDALAEYTTALRIDPNNPRTHFNLALLYMVRSGSLRRLGRVTEEKQQLEQAEREIREFLRLVPNTPFYRQEIENAWAALDYLQEKIR